MCTDLFQADKNNGYFDENTSNEFNQLIPNVAQGDSSQPLAIALQNQQNFEENIKNDFDIVGHCKNDEYNNQLNINQLNSLTFPHYPYSVRWNILGFLLFPDFFCSLLISSYFLNF